MSNTSINVDQIRQYFLGLQERITAGMSEVDGKNFATDSWTKPADAKLKGDGRSMILEEGNILERGGVGFSHVRGDSMPPSATAHRPELAGRAFEAMGVSLVFHPRNPHIPTVHLNVRCFIAQAEGKDPVWWFGGGMDLTPYYGDEADCKHFHQTCKNALDSYDPELHPRFKKWCDEYFFLKHRNETRGVGGLFFDDLNAWDDKVDFDRSFAFMQAVGNGYADAIIPIIERRKDTPWGERERKFQCYRRGRYVEFNLVHDKGTLFGLKTNGRIESILMSLPPHVQWVYDHHPESGSEEEKLIKVLENPINWIED